jgi:4'-phosphopantetheinyl transferase
MDVFWLEQVEADVPPNDDWLSASEAACLARMRFPKRRADWRLGRWTAKRAVSEYLTLQRPLAAVEIRAAPSGAPQVFLGSQAAKLAISLSHRAGRAVCVVAPDGTALGCDLELVEPRSDAFAADYFTTGEQSLVARAAPDNRPELLALLWSGKESALKALGEGLRLDTRCVAISLEESVSDCDVWRPLQATCDSGRTFYGWWRRLGDMVRTMVAAPAPDRPIASTFASR